MSERNLKLDKRYGKINTIPTNKKSEQKDQFSLTETFKGKSETFYEILKNSQRAWFGSKHQGFLTVNWDRIINKRHR